MAEPKEHPDDPVEMALELGKALLPIKDAADILMVSEAELTEKETELGKAYLKGKLLSKMDMHRIIIRQALAGSKPAQDLMKTMFDKIDMDGG